MMPQFDELYHEGKKRRSGRYPWGSGEVPYQHESWFMKNVRDYRAEGLDDKEIAKRLGMTNTEFKRKYSNEQNMMKLMEHDFAVTLRDKGVSTSEIARRVGKNESTIRSWLDEERAKRAEKAFDIADQLQDEVDSGAYLDIGTGVEKYLGCTPTRFKQAIAELEDRGYTVENLYIEQLGRNDGAKTTVTVLAPPNMTVQELYESTDKIKVVNTHIDAVTGDKKVGELPVNNIDSKRIMIRYAEDGGADKDGVIELRRGVEDISLGNAKYAQVRIGVDGTHYLKGMAVYADDLPDGVDIRFNTNKTKDKPMLGPDSDHSVLKLQKRDEATGELLPNPFGASIKPEENLRLVQKEYIGADGKKHVSALNVVSEEGDWSEWSKTLSSQFLSKQSPVLAKRQLDIAAAEREAQLEAIKEIDNPTVRRKMLIDLGDDCDAAAVHLKAAGLPRQASYAILPVPELKDNEIYAPKFKDGEIVDLVRHPHAGQFEIPQLVVNNKSKAAKAFMNQATDAVGINPKVAQQLSGADFDGDTVLVIPNPNGKLIQSRHPYQELLEFEPKVKYAAYEGMPRVGKEDHFDTQMQMGVVSNLITDMTIAGADKPDIIKAVKHSMVVIDAEKHNLDWQRSELDNDIARLKKEYQGKEQGGASTIISKAKSPVYVDQRKLWDKKSSKSIDPETGEKIYKLTGKTYKEKEKIIDPVTGKQAIDPETGKGLFRETGKVLKRQTKITKMESTKDARELLSDAPGRMEMTYADYANRMKALGNKCRLLALNTEDREWDTSPATKQKYAKEIASLDAKLSNAEKNAPLERQAQIVGNINARTIIKSNPGLSKKESDRIKGQQIAAARVAVGAKKQRIDISDSEWAAIQAGAISPSKLTRILNNANEDRVKALAMPKAAYSLNPAQEKLAKSMARNGYTQAEIADRLGVSASTVANLLVKN